MCVCHMNKRLLTYLLTKKHAIKSIPLDIVTFVLPIQSLHRLYNFPLSLSHALSVYVFMSWVVYLLILLSAILSIKRY